MCKTTIIEICKNHYYNIHNRFHAHNIMSMHVSIRTGIYYDACVLHAVSNNTAQKTN